MTTTQNSFTKAFPLKSNSGSVRKEPGVSTSSLDSPQAVEGAPQSFKTITPDSSFCTPAVRRGSCRSADIEEILAGPGEVSSATISRQQTEFILIEYPSLHRSRSSLSQGLVFCKAYSTADNTYTLDFHGMTKCNCVLYVIHG